MRRIERGDAAGPRVYGATRNRGLALASCSALALIMAGSAAFGAEVQSAAGGTDERQSQLEEVVVTARRIEENLQSTPIAVSSLSGEDLARHSMTKVDELQQMVPGMMVSQNQAAPLSVTFALRGQTHTDLIAILDPPIGIYIDGAYMNSSFGVLGIGMTDIERVEVLKGPQGTLYGRNTTGGAINFYTREPTDTFGGLVSVGGGSYHAYSGAAVVNAPINDSLAVRLVADLSGDRGYAHNALTGGRIADKRSEMIRGALKYTPSDNLRIMLRGDYTHARADGGQLFVPLYILPNSAAATVISRAAGVPVAEAPNVYAPFTRLPGSPYTVSINNPNNAKVVSWGGSATAEYDLGGAQLKSISAYRHIDDRKSTDVDATPFNIFFTDPFITTIRQYSQEFQITGDGLADRLHYTGGVYFFRSKNTDNNRSWSLLGVSTTQPTVTAAKVDIKSQAAYGQAVFDLTDTVHLTGGLRYTHESRFLTSSNRTGPAGTCNVPPPATQADCRATFGVKENNISYTAGIDWQATSDVMLYAKTSRGFKSGGVNERVSRDPASVAPFEAEVVTDYEVGLKSEWFDRRLRLNGDIYRSYYKNAQRSVFLVNSTGGVFTTIFNAASAVIDGAELELAAVPVTGLTLGATFGYIDPEYRRFIDPATRVDLSGQAFRNVSKWTYSYSIGYVAPTKLGDLEFQIDYAGRSSRNLLPTGGVPSLDLQPGYGILNARVKLSVAEQDWDVAVYAKNILEKRYFANIFDTAPGIGIVSGIPGAPRTWGVVATKRF